MAWLWWVGAALVLGVAETLTADLTLIMFAGGALGGGLTSLLGGPLWLQVVVFAIVSTLLLVAVRPWAKRRLASTTPEMLTNASAQIGREATALTAVDQRGGRVRLGGEEWSARLAAPAPETAPETAPGPTPEPSAASAAVRVEPGTRLRVTAIDGAVAVVVPEH